MRDNKVYFSEKQERKIVEAIKKAEKRTSGEIRVHIDAHGSESHFETAVEVFKSLNMENTEERNGVLFHLSLVDKNLTIIGDIGIDKVVPENFWQDINHTVIRKFKKKKYTKGLIKGIKMTGKALKKYFPYQADDINELPDEISKR